MKTLIRFWSSKEDGGQAVVLLAITFLAMLMIVGLAVDAGQLYSARRTMQEAADAGAYAGAVVLYQQGSQSEARLAAVADTTRNGFTDGVNGFTVTVNAPPLSGLNINNNLYVEVIIQGSVRTTLVPAQSVLSTVRVRAAAGAEPLNNAYAIMALDRANTPSAFSLSPNADVHVTGGGILVNSTSSTAATSSQCTSSRFTIGTPYGTDVSGNATGCFPTTGDGLDVAQPQQADPFAGYPRPSTAGMTTYSSIPPGGILFPGIWTTEIRGSGNSLLQLTSGIYITKGGVDLAGTSDIESLPGGVFIFNTHTNYPGSFRAGIDSCGGINLQGTSSSSLSAMTAAQNIALYGNDDYATFLVYQDPACTNEMKIGGTSSFNGTGTIYLPTAHFRFDGNNATLTGSQLVAKTIDVQNGNLTIAFDPTNTAQPILPRLSE